MAWSNILPGYDLLCCEWVEFKLTLLELLATQAFPAQSSDSGLDKPKGAGNRVNLIVGVL